MAAITAQGATLPMGLLRAVAVCAGLLLVAAAPAAGAFPGANGKIVFVSPRDHPDSCPPVCRAPIYEIYVANADGSAPTRLTHDGGPDDSYSAPSFSPDGRRIAFGRGGHIFAMDADGTDRVQLTSGDCGGSAPAFSPDGSRIVYDVLALSPACRPEETGIAVIEADGGNRNLSGHAGSGPVWAPDGNRIAFSCGDHICTMTPAGGDLQQLTTSSGREVAPNYSPDGSWIAFNHVFGSAPASEIYVIAADGSGDLRRLTFNDDAFIVFRGFDANPVFSPDGTKIAYSSSTHGSGIHVMNADGTNITLLTCPASGFDGTPNWGPLVSPSDTGSGAICDADFDDDGVANPSDTCPYLPGPADGLPPGCPKLSPPAPPVRTAPPLPTPPSIAPVGDKLPAAVARELAQAGRALARCGTTGLLSKAGCRDSFTALGPGVVVYRVTAPAAGRRTAMVAVIASARRAIPAAGTHPVKVKATKKGRKSLRKARKLRATLTVTFTDSAGNVVKRSQKVVLRRKND